MLNTADSLLSASQNLSDQLRGRLNRGRRPAFLRRAFFLLKVTFIRKMPLVSSALISNTAILIQTLYCITPDRLHYQPIIVAL